MNQSNVIRAHTRVRNITDTHDDTGTRLLGGADNGHVTYTITHNTNIAITASTSSANDKHTYYMHPFVDNANANTMADGVCSKSGTTRT